MLFGRDITEHRATKPADHRRANTGRNMVVTGSDVGGQRPQRIKRCFIAALQLLVHIFLDELHRHMPWTFDHALHVMLPGDSGQLTKGFQLTELRCIVGVGDRTGTQAITQRKGHIIGLHDLADIVEVGIKEVFLMMCQAPFGHNGAATRHYSGHPFSRHRHITQQHSSMNGEVVHALLGLLNQGIAKNFPRQVLGDSIYFLQRLIDGDRTDGHRGVADDPLTGLVNIFTRGQIHHRIRAPANTPGHLLHLFFDGGA